MLLSDDLDTKSCICYNTHIIVGEHNVRRNCIFNSDSISDRTEYWSGRDDLLGHLVEVQADAVTQNQDGTYSLRFPRFLRFRDFEAGVKL